MLHRLARFFISVIGLLIGGGAGYLTGRLFDQYQITWFGHQELIFILGFAIIGCFIFFILSNGIIKGSVRLMEWLEAKLAQVPMSEIILGIIGLIIGLFLAFLVSMPLRDIQPSLLFVLVSLFLYILLGYLGVSIMTKRWTEVNWSQLFRRMQRDKHLKNASLPSPKILDTSVIIDGRVLDIMKTGFMEGPLIIPSFVLAELQHIADSADELKRNRGRRGLDILKQMQEELNLPIDIHDKDYDDTDQVDAKLIRLAKDLGGKVITNDYNLNKVASVQGVEVLNINELSNAVKPVVLPGEEMTVQVIKTGREAGQGVAYLDDGTMIVVEGGRKFMGQTVDVLVTSVLQTAAGRMIFVRPKNGWNGERQAMS
jgi:uncharacterized protein YacL